VTVIEISVDQVFNMILNLVKQFRIAAHRAQQDRRFTTIQQFHAHRIAEVFILSQIDLAVDYERFRRKRWTARSVIEIADQSSFVVEAK
jgi:hypothetical protein